MKKLIITSIFLLISLQMISQEKKFYIYTDIIKQVWKPFKKAFDNKNAIVFNNIHTNDILRINSWGIKKGDAYKKNITKNYNQPSKNTRTIDFWIEQGVYSDSISHQIGYYAVIYKEKKAKTNKVTYAQFQVTLIKVNGTWKISQDFDTDMVGGKKVDASFVKNLEKLHL